MVRVVRLEQTEEGTLGVLSVNERMICFTFELPWKENQRNISCIPEGLYVMNKRFSWFNAERYGMTWEVLNVPNRHGILIHPGNTADDAEGCILPGMVVGRLKGKRAVLRSAEAFKLFQHEIGQMHQLHLRIDKLESGGVYLG